jgi:hypothetical protein
MKNILIHITTWVVAFWATAFMCAFCGDFIAYNMRGDTFTVIAEEKHGDIDSLSLYTIIYKVNSMDGTGELKSNFYVIMNKNAFEVGDKVKLIKSAE